MCHSIHQKVFVSSIIRNQEGQPLERAIERAKIRKIGWTKAEVGTWQVTNIPKVVNIVEGVRLKSPPWQEWSGWFYMEQDKFKSSFRNKDHLTECICCSLLGEEGLNIFILLFVSKLEWNPSAVSFFLEFKACYSVQSLRIPEVSAWELLSSRSQGEGREVGS